MDRKTTWLGVALVLLFGMPTAWATMTAGQAKALAVTAYKHHGAKTGAAALNKLEAAAHRGTLAAQYMLAGLYDFEHHFAKAAYWYKKAAKQGNAIAQYNLGVHYDNGQGVAKNETKAVYWYKKAAEQGYVRGQYNLGVHYVTGSGVPQSFPNAAYWYKKAAEQGDVQAQFYIAIQYSLGRGVPKNHSEALYWAKKAAANGYSKAEKLVTFLSHQRETIKGRSTAR